MSFHVLVVCTGNICRSAFAEVMGRQLFARHGIEAIISGAGLGAVVGSGMHPDTRAALAKHGLAGEAAADFRARQLEPEMVAAADLVLGATVEHRSGILRLAPKGLRTTFTMREFARLAGEVDPATLPEEPQARAHALVAAARAQRGLRPTAPGVDDIADPIAGTLAAHLEAADLVAEAMTAVAAALAAPHTATLEHR